MATSGHPHASMRSVPPRKELQDVSCCSCYAKAQVQAGEQQRVRRRRGRDSMRSEGGRKTGRRPQRWPRAANLSPCLPGTEQRRTISLAPAKLDNEEKEPKREKGYTKRKDASPLYFSSAVSLLASALVDHGRKQVHAAALLLWALVADRYNLMIS